MIPITSENQKAEPLFLTPEVIMQQKPSKNIIMPHLMANRLLLNMIDLQEISEFADVISASQLLREVTVMTEEEIEEEEDSEDN